MRYFLKFRGHKRAKEVSREDALKVLAGYYTKPWNVLREHPINYTLQTDVAYIWKEDSFTCPSCKDKVRELYPNHAHKKKTCRGCLAEVQHEEADVELLQRS